MQAAGKAPLAHHEAEGQHEEGADSCHDICDGHKGGLICLGHVVGAVLQLYTMEGALH